MNQEDRDFLSLVGARVRTAREELRWSQERLAFESGLHRTYLSQLELGLRNPSICVALRIAKALGISLSDLIEDQT